MHIKDLLAQELEQTPDTLLQEVLDFVLFLNHKYSTQEQASPTTTIESSDINDLVELDIQDYRANLEEYEEQLARGEIQW